jgi:hypothetical protein
VRVFSSGDSVLEGITRELPGYAVAPAGGYENGLGPQRSVRVQHERMITALLQACTAIEFHDFRLCLRSDVGRVYFAIDAAGLRLIVQHIGGKLY